MENSSNNKNLLLAILLSIFVLGLWQNFYVVPQSKKLHKSQLKLEKAVEKDLITSDIDEPKVEIVDRDVLLSKQQGNRISIKTPRLRGSINTKGFRFDDLTLVNYKQSKEEDSKEMVLLSPSNSNTIYFAEFGWLLDSKSGSNDMVPNHSTIWQSDSKELTVDKPIKLFWDNKQGLKFVINVSVDKNYLFTITQSVENYGKKDFHFFPYGTLNRTRDMSRKTFYISHEGMIGAFDGILSEVTYAKLKKDKQKLVHNSKGWFGIADKYWFTSIIPSQKNNFDTRFTYFYRNNQERFQADYRGQSFNVLPGKSYSFDINLFSGAKELNLLDSYNKSLNIKLLDRAVDFGWLYFITKPMFKFLTLLHKVFGNFGFAIIALTVFIKTLLFPLANKSYVSMNKIKRLQPRINELKERYKDDKIQLNKHIMEIYKNEKVNPLSGCLPMLVQLPIFFSLYKVLFVSIEMRQAEFIGWIKDLSLPDPTSVLTLFGLIDIDLPSVLHIGVWPILMSCSMVLQQKMAPPQSDPTQAKIVSFIPYVFLFIFASFPSGLVVYWTLNNLLSVLQQWLINRKLLKKEL